MNTQLQKGLLWYDADKKRSLLDKVTGAIEYYHVRCGRLPAAVYIHPRLLAGDAALVAAQGVRVEARSNIMMDHFFAVDPE